MHKLPDFFDEIFHFEKNCRSSRKAGIHSQLQNFA